MTSQHSDNQNTLNQSGHTRALSESVGKVLNLKDFWHRLQPDPVPVKRLSRNRPCHATEPLRWRTRWWWLYYSSDGVDTVIPLKVMIGFHFRTLQNWLYESNQQQISNNLPRHHFPISKTLASHTVRPWLVWINDLPMKNDDSCEKWWFLHIVASQRSLVMKVDWSEWRTFYRVFMTSPIRFIHSYIHTWASAIKDAFLECTM